MPHGSLTLDQAHHQGFDLVRRHTCRFLDYLDALDEAELERPVPGLDWTVRETIGHVRAVYGRYTVDVRRAATLRQLAEQNAADLTGPTVTREAARGFIEEQVAFLESVLPRVAPDQAFPFHAGQSVTLAGGWGNLLGELLAHGDDIARATGSPFGLPGEDLEVLWRFTVPALQGWVRSEYADLDESWLLRFPFGDGRLALRACELSWVTESPGPADHSVQVDDAAEFTLAFPYRRRPISDPAVALLATRFHDL